MGVFPEDYEIFVSQLIKLWVAEGFIKPLSHKSLEELAEDYLSNLIKRSLVEVRRRNDELPIGIVELVHLRYIALWFGGEGRLPESICKLWNLQTLVVIEGFGRLKVRHIISTIEYFENATTKASFVERGFLPYPFLAEVIGKDAVVLENLQTLSDVKNFPCTKEVLELMPNLKKLRISYVHESGTEWSFYEFNNFVYLQKLDTLKCEFISKDDGVGKHLPLKLALPSKSQKADSRGLHNFLGKHDCHCKLFGTVACRLYTFPRLQTLVSQFLQQVRGNPPEFGDIASLEMIELCKCSSSVVASAMLIQEEQQSLGNEGLRVRVNSNSDYRNSTLILLYERY
ncbi:putative late blight resistance proteinR1B-11 [Sesamum angolense]|uniref:Late blight resistance proteinR1B-11 n=1 Tax=Sesamum angolense TaxID=2727404 RepID=A0AAE1T7K1_9LAMI|nr:putative late blight resistance proteinR1B-11 [Sesamum angolense]